MYEEKVVIGKDTVSVTIHKGFMTQSSRSLRPLKYRDGTYHFYHPLLARPLLATKDDLLTITTRPLTRWETLKELFRCKK
jgi:hypothetical protein